MKCRRRPRLYGWVLPLVLLSSIRPAEAGAPSGISEAAVQRRIKDLTGALIARQQGNGSWPESRYATGGTALVVLALKHAGLSNDHPAVASALDYIVNHFEYKTYSESLVICALELAGPKKYRDRIEQSVRFLAQAQRSGGGWGYTAGGGSGFDNSNTQFAVLGLAAAQRCGITVPASVKRRALSHWLRCKSAGGGWSYGRGGGSSLSMTCAGIASLALLDRKYEKPLKRCGQYRYDTVLEKALKRMRERLPRIGQGGLSWESYTLYAIERVCMFLDLKDLDGFDWYRWGAARILSGRADKGTPQCAFDLLFLAKGEAQIGIAKWHWQGDWNNDHRDVKNWVDFGTRELNRKLDWVPASLKRSDSPAAKASLIFVNGHGRFTASEDETRFLRQYLLRKGTLVAEGCCGSGEFITSFKTFVKTRLYPKLPVRFVPIPPGHPVCKQKYTLLPEEVGALRVKIGCRKRRILLLTRDISCALNEEPGVKPEEHERARKVALNLLQWAMESKTPRGKLAKVDLADLPGARRDLVDDAVSLKTAVASRRLRQPFGRLIHRGEWEVDLALFPTLYKAIAMERSVPRFDGEVYVAPTSEDLFSCAVLFISGHTDPKLEAKECLPLRRYLRNGGTIIATACCGFEEFDRGFRRLMRHVLPNDRLEEIPAGDVLWKSPVVLRAVPVKATRAYVKRHGTRLAPLYGIRREGRWIVLYSPVDLCCDLEGDMEEDTVAYKQVTAVLIWINLLNYVFTP